MEWIDVENELPEYGCPVIISIMGTVQHVTYMRDGADDCADWFEPYHYEDNASAFFLRYDKKIFWMPLPEPPSN